MTPAGKESAEHAGAPPLTVDVEICCDPGGVPGEEFLRLWVGRALAAANVELPGAAEVALRVVSPDEIRALNSRYRGRDRPTNVLSFPAERPAGLPDDVPATLGDIVVCAAVVAAEAAEQDKAGEAHWAHMLVHGTLHLLGFDHAAPAEATRMETLEAEILARSGIADPYTAA
ncbi:MAG: rRNA maturation RNase YbeY [Woeseiaceae bacterium]|nr:rRNA maturation RNase YbeY [Woeseiaceae bacterium]